MYYWLTEIPSASHFPYILGRSSFPPSIDARLGHTAHGLMAGQVYLLAY